ncbi:MFS transporter [Svornostia abyssi]|uniref:MFS transporter n=1 Tax=Svornostia abyssi TaxID=2898438 RepID=A0ABY5PAR9_9ACTN|nr:MFS transporter [Parviterribacteraceae bacterium J379]
MSSPLPTSPRHPDLVLALVALAQLLIVLDATIVNVALPAIQDDLRLSDQELQWTINAYTLAFGGFLLLGGRAADLFGRRRLFVAGTLLFTVASALNALAESGTLLIAGRALQGVGGALVSPAALSIVTTTFPEGEPRTRALAIWGAVSAAGGAVGLLLGGLLTEWLSWQWIFLVNLPIGLFAAAAAARVVPESRADDVRGFDAPGAVTVTAGMVAVVFAITKAESWGFGDVRTIAVAAAGAVLLAVFVANERRQAEPLLRLAIFRRRTLATANAAMLLAGGAVFGMFYFGSLYLQRVLGLSPVEAGVAFLPFTVMIVAGAAFAQRLVGRTSAKEPILLGLGFATAGLLWYAQLDADGSYLADVLGPIVLIAFGMGNVFVALTLVATAGVAAHEQGLASGIFTSSQQVGGALGLAILGTVAADVAASSLADGVVPLQALVDGFSVALYVGAALTLTAMVLILAALPRRSASVDPAAAVTVV